MEEADQAPQKPVDRELVLHYIDKLHTAYVETGQALNRYLFLLVITAFLIFGLSLGIVTIDRSFSFGGLTVAINSGLILIGGSALIGMLYIYVLSLYEAEIRLRIKIVQLYRSVGLEEDIFLKVGNGMTVLGFGGILEVFSTDMYKIRGGIGVGAVIALIYMGVIVFFPIVAQIAACWRMVSLFGGAVWVIAPMALILLITAISFIFFGLSDPGAHLTTPLTK